MSTKTKMPFLPALAAVITLASAIPAWAAGEVIITHAKALAGNITPGDAPGYPVTLTKSGTYQLASNLAPPANQNGIEINIGFVTVDLNGYTLLGAHKAAKGIVGSKEAASIRNGSITSFKSDGIDGWGEFWTLDNVVVVKNGSRGVSLGENARITHSTISRNGYIGLACAHCHVEGNIVSYNGDVGVWLSEGSVLGNTIVNNDGAAIMAFQSTGFANNTLAGNNGGYSQVYDGYGLIKMLPNACNPACF